MSFCEKHGVDESKFFCYQCEEEAESAVASNDGLSGFIKVPRDPRTGNAQVNNIMKAMCIGHFSFERECMHEDEDGNLVTTEKIEVPWTTVKDIYKMMVMWAERSAT